MFDNHKEYSGLVKSSREQVFTYLDGHSRLSSHMTRSSWMMGGGRMAVSTDAGEGVRVGSIITLSGRALGTRLVVEEVVTIHDPPSRWLGRLLGGVYARWCTRSMVTDAVTHFASTAARTG